MIRNMANFDAIFFDMDGTIVENSRLMPGAFKEAFALFGYEISIDPWRGSGCTDYEVMDRYLADYPLSDEEKTALKEKIAAEVRRLVIEKVRREPLPILPGVMEVVARLNETGLHPGLLTGNMEAIVGPKLEAAGLKRSDFYYGGFGDHSACRAQTAQRALDSASEFLGHKLDPQRALIIGDTPNDIACARAVGAKALAVATGKFSTEELGTYQPDYLLENLCSIGDFFSIIENTPADR